jgi:pyridoxamine 5'-phosphate oxidase-like protein
MNVDVLHQLEKAVADRGPGAYVLTVSNDGRPHAVYLNVAWSDGRLVAEVGNTTAANARARPQISLLFPVRTAGDYSFFVDGRATVESGDGVHRLIVAPTRAVFHRHGPAPDPNSSCTADCMPVLQATTPLSMSPPRS